MNSKKNMNKKKEWKTAGKEGKRTKEDVEEKLGRVWNLREKLNS